MQTNLSIPISSEASPILFEHKSEWWTHSVNTSGKQYFDMDDLEAKRDCKRFKQPKTNRSKIRRLKANNRERGRMHGLNKALDDLKCAIPNFGQSCKLSKIDTLRLATNYIRVLTDILHSNFNPSTEYIANELCRGMSSGSVNRIITLSSDKSCLSNVNTSSAENYSLNQSNYLTDWNNIDYNDSVYENCNRKRVLMNTSNNSMKLDPLNSIALDMNNTSLQQQKIYSYDIYGERLCKVFRIESQDLFD